MNYYRGGGVQQELLPEEIREKQSLVAIAEKFLGYRSPSIAIGGESQFGAEDHTEVMDDLVGLGEGEGAGEGEREGVKAIANPFDSIGEKLEEGFGDGGRVGYHRQQDQAQLQETLQAQGFIKMGNEYHPAELEKRAQDVEDVLREIIVINQMVLDLAQLVSTQGEYINEVDKKATEASLWAMKGLVQIQRACLIQHEQSTNIPDREAYYQQFKSACSAITEHSPGTSGQKLTDRMEDLKQERKDLQSEIDKLGEVSWVYVMLDAVSEVYFKVLATSGKDPSADDLERLLEDETIKERIESARLLEKDSRRQASQDALAFAEAARNEGDGRSLDGKPGQGIDL